MKPSRRTASAVVAVACIAVAVPTPGVVADQPSTPPPGQTSTKDAKHSPSEATKRKGYGVLCKGLSKKHVAGQRGTPFSRCVVAAAHQRS
jgi:hypothetical protein